jgi:hypothetical protein
MHLKVFGDLNHGEEIFLSGNVPGLGCDDIARAIPLVTTPTEFPWWRTKEGKLEGNVSCFLVTFSLFRNFRSW